jgi:hypothetical protein
MPAGIGELSLQDRRMRSLFSLAASGGADKPMEEREFVLASAKDVYSIHWTPGDRVPQNPRAELTSRGAHDRSESLHDAADAS